MSIDVRQFPRNRIPTGLVVYDKDIQFTKQVVIKHFDELADEVYLPGGEKTVADVNPEYDSKEPVVGVVRCDHFDEQIDGWRATPVDKLTEKAKKENLTVYTYPAGRLKAAASSIPPQVETYREVFCWQFARMAELSATIEQGDQVYESIKWDNYRSRVRGEVSMSKVLKENKYQYSGGRGVCSYCNQEVETVLDHVIPVNSGGKDSMDNIVPACQTCNSSKNDENVLKWCKENGIALDRIVLGKYLKQRWNQLKEEGRLDTSMPTNLRERIEGVEIVRKVENRAYLDATR